MQEPEGTAGGLVARTPAPAPRHRDVSRLHTLGGGGRCCQDKLLWLRAFL